MVGIKVIKQKKLNTKVQVKKIIKYSPNFENIASKVFAKPRL